MVASLSALLVHARNHELSRKTDGASERVEQNGHVVAVAIAHAERVLGLLKPLVRLIHVVNVGLHPTEQRGGLAFVIPGLDAVGTKNLHGEGRQRGVTPRLLRETRQYVQLLWILVAVKRGQIVDLGIIKVEPSCRSVERAGPIGHGYPSR